VCYSQSTYRTYTTVANLTMLHLHLILTFIAPRSFSYSQFNDAAISWADHVRNEEVLKILKEESNILQTVKRRKANWIGRILRRKCLLKHVTERQAKKTINVRERRGRWCKQLLDNHKEIRGYWKFNPLNPELNPICYLLALLGAHHFLHVSRIRVRLLTFRLLMSYVYGAPTLDVSRSHTTTQHSR